MEVVPQVAGRVVYVHSELRAGGVIRANEKIAQIDPRDYELAVRQAQVAVADAEARLDTEIAEAEVERPEWAQPNAETGPDALRRLRELRIRRARAALELAETQLALTELELERTTISLPFSAMITGKVVELGQYVQIGQRLATAHGIDAFEIEVLLDDEDLARVDALRSPAALADGTDGELAPVRVRAEFAGVRHTWNGYVTRTAGRVDPASRKVPVVVEIAKPLEASAGKPPLWPGVVAEVLIAGKTLDHAIAVPLEAVREGNRVWLVDDGRLAARFLEIMWINAAHAYVTSGLPDGALVVANPIDGLEEGMTVRTSKDIGDG
jgi:RND family efflux transporter MFP subunit